MQPMQQPPAAAPQWSPEAEAILRQQWAQQFAGTQLAAPPAGPGAAFPPPDAPAGTPAFQAAQEAAQAAGQPATSATSATSTRPPTPAGERIRGAGRALAGLAVIAAVGWVTYKLASRMWDVGDHTHQLDAGNVDRSFTINTAELDNANG